MTLILRAVLLSIFLFMPFSAYAGCTYIAEIHSSSLYMDISDGGCGELSISFTKKIDTDGQPDHSSIQSFSFAKECVLTSNKNGSPIRLSCHEKGRTPLAGASYVRKKVGYTVVNCGYEGEKDHKEIDFQWVCTKGCSKPSVPKALDERYICD
jgi:hypothetical protein